MQTNYLVKANIPSSSFTHLTHSVIRFLFPEKKEDLKAANFQKMRVKTLKKILDDWGERCVGCTEKSDYVKLIEEKMPIYDPEAYKFRQAKKTEL